MANGRRAAETVGDRRARDHHGGERARDAERDRDRARGHRGMAPSRREYEARERADREPEDVRPLIDHRIQKADADLRDRDDREPAPHAARPRGAMAFAMHRELDEHGAEQAED